MIEVFVTGSELTRGQLESEPWMGWGGFLVRASAWTLCCAGTRGKQICICDRWPGCKAIQSKTIHVSATCHEFPDRVATREVSSQHLYVPEQLAHGPRADNAVWKSLGLLAIAHNNNRSERTKGSFTLSTTLVGTPASMR